MELLRLSITGTVDVFDVAADTPPCKGPAKYGDVRQEKSVKANSPRAIGPLVDPCFPQKILSAWPRQMSLFCSVHASCDIVRATP